MKSKYIISKSSLIAIAILISSTLNAQRGTRDESRRSRQETRNEARGTQSKNRQNSQTERNRNYVVNKNKDVDVYNKNKKKSDSKNHPDYKNSLYKEERHYNHENGYSHKNRNHKETKAAYRRHLPNNKFVKFHHGNNDYYHCNNHFYRYDPRFGYLVVDAPFIIINQLPNRYYVRIIDGQKYIYANGNVYVPYGYQYIMMPESFNQQSGITFSLRF